MRQPKPRVKDPGNSLPFYKDQLKYRTWSFVLGMLSSTLFVLSLRASWTPGAFVGAVLMFLGAGLALTGLAFASVRGDLKLVAHLCLIAMWLVLLPLTVMSYKLKSEEAPKGAVATVRETTIPVDVPAGRAWTAHPSDLTAPESAGTTAIEIMADDSQDARGGPGRLARRP